ncbi:MAG: glycosyl hydrolase family 57 [Phycisphaerae bacterium]|nr:glycosyl hydrolase family 57 [Phycisphaerae bacterium]
MNTQELDRYVDGLPNLCGSEDRVAEAMARPGPYYLPESGVAFDRIQAGFSFALHMHQPLIPAGGPDLRTAQVISNLAAMMAGGDRYNAGVFHDCYKRMGDFIPELVRAGRQPRAMLDYSGCLLHGLIQMGLTDVIDKLRPITCDPGLRCCVEWVGTAWGHAVAPSTPVQDFRLHVRAWQHFFAAVFGLEALSRVRGFSPPEMALPNHPDVFFEFVKTLKECGYRWVLVQEHTVEAVEGGGGVRDPHVPHRLVARNSRGQTLTITAVIKTQGSDTKLVAQMQPYYEARGQGRRTWAGRSIPALVTQVADGENGGVMMNEFPSKYREVMAEASGSATPPVNVSEVLEYLDRLGVTEADFPTVQPIGQGRIWQRLPEGAGPEALDRLIRDLAREDSRFHMEGGSWTNNISWVRGYEHVLGPMQMASAQFAEKVLARGVPTREERYRRALFHLLISQTSCFRYWGEGQWTEYGRELCRRATEILKWDF